MTLPQQVAPGHCQQLRGLRQAWGPSGEGVMGSTESEVGTPHQGKAVT